MINPRKDVRRGWLAAERDADDAPPGHRWSPVLQVGGQALPLQIWFATEEACQSWIVVSVLGAALYD